MHGHMQRPGEDVGCLPLFSLILLRHGLSLNLKLAASFILTVAPEFYLSLLSNFEVTNMYSHDQHFMCEYWRFELRPLCLQIAHTLTQLTSQELP